MSPVPYSFSESYGPELEDKGPIGLSEKPEPHLDVLSHTQATLRLAVFLGIPKDEPLVFDAPLLSRLCGRRMFFLRGWKRYASCVKGFNALGLLAEHAGREEQKFSRLPQDALRSLRREYLAARRVFSKRELAALKDSQLAKVDLLSLSLWSAFAGRTIVCATSSNLGICLHQALRDMRLKTLAVAGKCFKLLNEDEGRIVIWCPDERADFMSAEKSALLSSLEAEHPRRTVLRTYINRRQRDPGALKQALACGGCFFPTNPQSRAELKSLLTQALREISGERGMPMERLLKNTRIKATLESLGAVISGGRIILQRSLEAGMLGMALPYQLMIEEARQRGDTRPLCIWNPVSIGAALAALTLCDRALRQPPDGLDGMETRIHGVFDSANLQSLAQLFGVVAARHTSGRQTAYVGLGSSSYANGNLCFEILSESASSRGAFRGRGHLHPATHAINPIAQALIFAEELFRAARGERSSARKPEPAGAAALAGYLLARLDGGTLSFVEISYALRCGGFTKATFLEFAGFGTHEEAARRYIEEAREEGASMESLARGVLSALDWDWKRLRLAARNERVASSRAYAGGGLDDSVFEEQDPAVHIHLTGDYCVQPSPILVERIQRNGVRTRKALPKGEGLFCPPR